MFLADIILLGQLTDMFFKFSLFDSQAINIGLDAFKHILQSSLDNRLTLPQSFDIVVFVFSVNDTFRTDALTIALETVVKEFLFWMFRTVFLI